MKKTLLFIALIASATFSAQTNLVLNGTADIHTIDPNDNADSFDMTPPSTLDDGVDSPYRALWNNSNLDSWLNDNCGNSSEQPGSSSDGNWDYSAGSDMGVITRGVKISTKCRRLYQVIAVTQGAEYTFSIESRSEAENVPSEVYILNTEIESEDGLSSTSSSVDHYLEITNDFNASKSSETENNFTKSTFTFTASSDKIVIYVRAPLAVDNDNEVFYDNLELVVSSAAPAEPTGVELVLNGTGDEYTNNTSDNADAWDMTPNSTLIDNSGTEIDSPFRALWNNSTLGSYLEDTYNGGSGVDEQPGSTGDGTYDGATKTRGLKLYGDGDPETTESTRRLYQKIAIEMGSTYTFSIDSRSEAENVPSDVYILNEEITTEVGLENGAADSRVDAYLQITNDFNSSTGGEGDNTFTNNTFTFTATTTTAVIYVRALLANSDETEVFYDNISLKKMEATASVKDVFADNITIYPNPANNFINISTTGNVSTVEVYNIVGKRVLSIKNIQNNQVDITNLSTGMYMLRLTNGTSVATKKIIKQ